MSRIKDLALASTTIKALTDLVKSQDAQIRVNALAELVARYEDEGIKSLDVKLPDGTKVATVTLTIPKAEGAVLVDQDALLKWARKTCPHKVEKVPRVVTPAHDRLVPGFLDELLPHLVDHDGEAADPESGEVIPGIEFRSEAPTPKSFSIRFVDDQARKNVLTAWRTGQIGDAAGMAALPEGGAQ